MPPTSVFTAGNVALISGAASGVGLAVAKLCAKHGMKLALLDWNTENLHAAKESFKSPDVETYTVDVSQLSQWTDVKSKVQSRFGPRLDFLMLNAGIGPKGTWGDSEYFDKILSTNLYGVIHGLNTFIPTLQSTPTHPSAVVITGSKQGITNPPGNAAYNASKSAVKTLAEHLSYDLKDTATSVHLLVPGWTFTGLTKAAGATDKPEGAWYPEQVADYLYEKMGDGEFYVICPDNDVTKTDDKKRMLWSVGDIVNGRQPLSRWRDEYMEEAKVWMAKQNV